DIGRGSLGGHHGERDSEYYGDGPASNRAANQPPIDRDRGLVVVHWRVGKGGHQRFLLKMPKPVMTAATRNNPLMTSVWLKIELISCTIGLPPCLSVAMPSL